MKIIATIANFAIKALDFIVFKTVDTVNTNTHIMHLKLCCQRVALPNIHIHTLYNYAQCLHNHFIHANINLQVCICYIQHTSSGKQTHRQRPRHHFLRLLKDTHIDWQTFYCACWKYYYLTVHIPIFMHVSVILNTWTQNQNHNLKKMDTYLSEQKHLLA